MANYATLKAAVADVVKTNGTQAITGENLQIVLLAIINSLGAGYQFAGVATPSTDAGTPDQNVCYIGGAGTYANFGSTTCIVPVGSIGLFRYDGYWTFSTITLFDGVDDVPTEDSINFVKSGGIYQKDAEIESSIALKLEESPYNNPDVLSYYTDEENRVFAIQYKDGSIKKLALTEQEIADAGKLNMLSSDSPYQDSNVLKYLVDENNTCFGYLKKDGTVVLYKAEIKNYKNNESDITSNQFSTIVSLLANGIDNINVSKNTKFMTTLHNLFGNEKIYINDDNINNVNLTPRLSIIDDDTVDHQIPSSTGEESPTTNTGGYFSVLLPMILSLGEKYGKKMAVGLACEGHRVGLTPLRSTSDEYTSLNENGQAVKWLHNNMGWNVFNHSMTAQLPEQAYFVNGITSTLANTILSEYDGSYYQPLSFHNLCVLDKLTGKWYEVNSQSHNAWVERTPTKKYAMPFYRDYTSRAWYFNRDFDFEYSWGEWCKRADELGLPYEKVIVHNGGTSSVYMCSAGRKYAYWSVRTTGIHNYPPIPAMVNRTTTAQNADNGGAMGYNVYNPQWVEYQKSCVDYCIENKTWMVYMSHMSDQAYHRNYYLDNREYPDRDDNYNSEWIIPLKHDEIMDIIGENIHDYINHPPSRLSISTWGEWYPAPGTHLAGWYEVLEYALTKGVEFVTPMEGWNTHGNVLNLGVDRNGQTYPYDSASSQVPYTDDEQSYLTVGADMSIRYYNSKQ